MIYLLIIGLIVGFGWYLIRQVDRTMQDRYDDHDERDIL